MVRAGCADSKKRAARRNILRRARVAWSGSRRARGGLERTSGWPGEKPRPNPSLENPALCRRKECAPSRRWQAHYSSAAPTVRVTSVTPRSPRRLVVRVSESFTCAQTAAWALPPGRPPDSHYSHSLARHRPPPLSMTVMAHDYVAPRSLPHPGQGPTQVHSAAACLATGEATQRPARP